MRVLILSRTPIGRRMSSPGIRYVNMARVLRAALPGVEVVLASPPVAPEERLDGVTVTYYRPSAAWNLARRFDVVIAMSFPMSMVVAAPFLKRPLLVLDFFSQFYVEWMEMGRGLYEGRQREAWTRARNTYADLQLLVADHVLCANERQRDSYIGALGALGRLTPAVYEADPSLRGLIDVVPHGVRPEPAPSRRSPAGLLPGLREGDKLLLWLGGILSWYDPLTLLRAVARVRVTHPEAKLLFLGSAYPGGSELGQGGRYREAVDEATRLNLLNEGVFFVDEWLPHEAVVEYLSAAAIGVTTYFTNAETRFAHRTRFMDYVWARLPIVCTDGDVLAEAINQREWGIAVPEQDEDALVAALTRLLEDEDLASRCRANLEVAAREMTWEVALEPLVRHLSQAGGPSAAGESRAQRRLSILRAAAKYGLARAGERLVSRGSS